jgi:aminoglycoside phosphotransferase family enzyme
MDSGQKEILSAINTQGTAVEKRLDALESAVARLDERTKK